jgi:pyruvate/2-oxoglutarate dehydrogenase complex dihydrolipoamide dehydrogenase (E3) component
MDARSFDFVVIGGGSAGYAAARTAAALGLTVAVIEGGPEVGGLCILRGCMPSKTLLESAARSTSVRRAGEFGIRATFEGADGPAIQRRRKRLIDEFASYREGQLRDGRFTFLRGRARFEGPHHLAVTPLGGAPVERIEGKTFLVATGSVIQPFELPGLAAAQPWTSDDVLVSSHIPESVIVLGGGAIALELATYYNGLGVRTTVIQRSEQVLKGSDRDVADALADGMRHEGVEIVTGTQLQSVTPAERGWKVHFLHSGQPCTRTAERIVQALGRIPAVEELGLNTAGITQTEHQISVTPTQQTCVPHIFAAGDVCGPLEVVHVAIQQGEVAARNACAHLRGEPLTATMDYRLKLFAVFTHPEMASVGLTEREAGGNCNAASYPFNDHGKSMVMGETAGFVKLIAEPATGRLIGGAVVGPHAAELIHEITVALALNATASQLAAIPHYHPTLSEIWTYPAEDLADRCSG